MNMKDMIQQMTDLENNAKQEITESRRIAECPPAQMAATPMSAPASEGTPVSINVNMTASGKEHVDDLLAMMKSAGLGDAKAMSTDMMPMRQDMDRLRSIVDEPEVEGYDNEPDEEYRDHEYMTHDLSGGINRRKKSYSDAEDGDNAMAVEEGDHNYDERVNAAAEYYFDVGEPPVRSDDFFDICDKFNVDPGDLDSAINDANISMDTIDLNSMQETIKSRLLQSLEEKKSKPDFLDVDKDGDKKEPMKQAVKDKGSKPKKGKVPPQFAKKESVEIDEISSDLAKRYTKAAKMDRDFNDDDLAKLPNKVRHGTDDQAKQASADMSRLQRRNSKRQTGINQAKKRMK